MCSSSFNKRCTKCQSEKSLTEFARKGVRSDGSLKYESLCKSCKSQVDSRRYKKSRKDAKMKKSTKAKAPAFHYEFSASDEGANLERIIELCIRNLERKSKEGIIP